MPCPKGACLLGASGVANRSSHRWREVLFASPVCLLDCYHKAPRAGDGNNSHVSRRGSGGWKADSKVLPGSVPSEARGPLGLQMAVHSILYVVLLLCVSAPVSKFPLYEDTRHTRLEPILVTSS